MVKVSLHIEPILNLLNRRFNFFHVAIFRVVSLEKLKERIREKLKSSKETSSEKMEVDASEEDDDDDDENDDSINLDFVDWRAKKIAK